MIRVLVIDDDDHVRSLYDNLLTREGFDVLSTACPEKALNIIRTDKPDIVVLDIELDGNNGLKLIEKYKTEDPYLPIILNSAYSIYMSDFKTWMAEAYIVKSSDIQPLIEKIKELADPKREYEQNTK
ncbi:MAG: response regulator [candidate division Zixibacteria bacterium]|nr:response regulator [candidate division Zixibacteria bacterium]